MIEQHVVLSVVLVVAFATTAALAFLPHRWTHGHVCETCKQHARDAAEKRYAAEAFRRAKDHGYFHRAYPMVEIGDKVRCIHCKHGIDIEP